MLDDVYISPKLIGTVMPTEQQALDFDKLVLAIKAEPDNTAMQINLAKLLENIGWSLLVGLSMRDGGSAKYMTDWLHIANDDDDMPSAFIVLDGDEHVFVIEYY